MVMEDYIKEDYISKLTKIINTEKEAINLCRKLKYGEIKINLENYDSNKYNEIEKLLTDIVDEANYKYMDFYFLIDCSKYDSITVTILEDYILSGLTKYDIECEFEICLYEINEYINFEIEIESLKLLKQILETKNGITEFDKIKIDNFYKYLIEFDYLTKVKKEILSINAQTHEMELKMKSYIFKLLKKYIITN